MSKTTTITSPSAANMPGDHTSFFGSTAVTFRDGVAKIENISDALLGYFEARGFGVNGDEPEPAPEPAEPPDPRDVGTVEGSPLRDAAVDPAPGDFLPPTNAGEANPHGGDVVAPGIHANEGVRPVKAGDVTYNGDTQAQSDAELAHTEAATDGTQVELTDEEQDLLGLNTEDAGDPDAETKKPSPTMVAEANVAAEDLKGQALYDALKDAGLPNTGTADEKRAALAEFRKTQG